MKILLLYKSGDLEIAEQISAVCKAVGTQVILYPYESPWKENLLEYLSDNPVVIAVVDKDFFKYASSVFALGYILGKNMSLILYKKNRYKLPHFFIDIPNTDKLRSLIGILQKELEKGERMVMREEAKKKLKEMGFEFTTDAYIQTIEDGEILAVEQFLKGGFSPNLEDKNGVPLICLAARRKHRAIVSMLLKKGAYINAVSKDRGNTALMDAAAEKDIEILKDLIDAGAHLDIKSKSGQTALILAVGQKDENIASILITAGASVTETDNLGMSAEKYARLFNLIRIIDLIENRI